MPSLPTSSPSIPSFSLSPSGIAAVVLFVVLVLGGCGVYFVAVPFLRRKMEERRMKVTDSEVCATLLSSFICARCRTPPSLRSSTPLRKYAVHLLLSSTGLTPFVSRQRRPPLPLPSRRLALDCPCSFLADRRPWSPAHPPRRVQCRLPRAVRLLSHPFKSRAFSSPRCRPGARAPIKVKDAVISKAPFVATQKSPRERLRQSPNSEVPARFGTSRNSPRREPSPLRTVSTAPEPEPEPAPVIAKAASQHVEEPPIAHALAGLFASTYQDAEDGDSSHFFDCSYDEEHLIIDLDLGRAVPAPVPVSVTAPPSGIPIIIVESPSLILGDRPLDECSSRTRQRSNSFKDSLAVRKRAPSSIAQQHGGSKGKKGDSRLLQVPKLLDSQDKENENGRQWVTSRPHPARTSP
ncbi:hypothetical protein B0H13DRAFT_2043031 [Mycena leptocephala]|nr:hypothetical protein B0H13DRAFT_2043031 [Mycena leptocephala]